MLISKKQNVTYAENLIKPAGKLKKGQSSGN